MLKNMTVTYPEVELQCEIWKVWVTMHSDGTKLEGIQSISTSTRINPICRARAMVEDSICAICYAENLLKMRKGLDKHIEENFRMLTRRLLTDEEIAAVVLWTRIVRIESFGDVANVIQARNYIRIIRANPSIQFGIWTKNLDIWNKAFDIEGKPANCSFVYSSPKINEPAILSEYDGRYVDHIFTVYDKEHYVFFGTEHHCAGVRCLKCLKCYYKGTPYHIAELKRGGKKKTKA